MFFVGLDTLGDKLIEINVFSPGAFYKACEFTGIDFSEDIIQSIESKVYVKKLYGSSIPNHILAAM